MRVLRLAENMIERGLDRVIEEITFWEDVRTGVKKLKEKNYRLRHGGLSEILYEGRAGR